MRGYILPVLLVLLALPVCADDWTYNMAFSQWSGSNNADRYYTNTPEACDERAAALAGAGYTAAICSGYHFRLNWLERDDDVVDIMRMIVEASHRHGLKVIEHVDLTIAYYDAYPLVWANPDWLQLHAADMMTRHRIFCLNNPQFQRFYLDYIERWQRETGLDAWQMDEISWLGRGFCGCRWCREKWREDTGRDYPAVEAPSFFGTAFEDPDYREWMRWRGKCVNDFYRLVGDALRAINPDVQIFEYSTSSQASPWAWTRKAPFEVIADTLDTVGTELNHVPFHSYPSIAALLAQRRAVGEVSGNAAWAKFDITGPSAYFCWAFGRTTGHSIWWSLTPDHEDPRPQDLLNWPWQMDDRTARLDADIGVLLSGSTRDLVYSQNYFAQEFEGWLQALLLQPLAAQPIIESEVTEPGALDRYRLIVLPNATAISAEQKAALMDYARAGGRLLLTHEAGTLYQDGMPSLDPLITEAGVTLLAEAVDPNTVDDRWRQTPLSNVSVADNTVIAARAGETEAAPVLLTRLTVGEGEVWYFAGKVGPMAHEPPQLPSRYGRADGYVPPEDPGMIEVIGDIVNQILRDAAHLNFGGPAPRGLMAWVYRAERDGRAARAIHLLNCTGRQPEEGDPVEFDHDNPPPMPPLPELTLRLPGGVAEALLATPEQDEPLELAVAMAGGTTTLTIPAESFSTYGVIWAYDE